MILNFDFTPTKKVNPNPIYIPLEKVVNSALENWSRLGCNNNAVDCKYFYNDEKDTRCVIGIAFDKNDYEKVKLCNKNVNIWKLYDMKIVETDNIDMLQELQILHDDACREIDEIKASNHKKQLKNKLEDLQKNLSKST